MGIKQWLFDNFVSPPEFRDLPAPAPRAATAVAPIQESFGGGDDPDALLSAAQGGSAYFRRLSGQHAMRDLSPMTAERALAVAYGLYDSNPVARRIPELIRDFILGEGVEVRASDPDERRRAEAQTIIARFWRDPDNRLDQRLYDLCVNLSIGGELIVTLATNAVNGAVKLGVLDPALVAGVISAHGNVERPIAIALKGPAGGPAPRYKIAAVDEEVVSPTFGRLVGVRRDRDGVALDYYIEDDQRREYAGACLLYRINRPALATRGRGDLLPLVDWCDALDQILFAEVDRSLLTRSFVWDVTVTGATETEIEAYIKKLGTPKPGTVRGHNEKVLWQAVSPNLNVWDAANAADLLLSYISAGAGIPKTWLSGTIDTNRATASVMNDAALKRLTARQLYVKYILTELVTFALDQAELAGRIQRRTSAPGVLPEPWPLTVLAPDLRLDETTAVAESLKTTAEALETARRIGVLDLETAQAAMATQLAQSGVAVDLDAMRARLAKEQGQTIAPTPTPLRQVGD